MRGAVNMLQFYAKFACYRVPPIFDIQSARIAMSDSVFRD